MADKQINISQCDIENVTNYITVNKEEPLKNQTFNWLNSTNCFKGRSEIFKKTYQYFITNKMVVIYGAPGIGKTETARNFANQNSEYFAGNLIWIFSETEEKIRKCFEDLSKSFGLKIPDVSQVYGKFRLSRCLFIFDNAENKASIKNYLPSSQVHPTVSVLITSQFSQWDSSISKVPLSPLILEDALDIIRDKLGDKFRKYPIKIWEELVEHLERIPLSMQIVSALINQEFCKIRFEEFNLENFVNALSENFITSKFPKSEIVYYYKTVLTSIYSVLNRLEKDGACHSLDILCFMAYLDADRISYEILLLVPKIQESKNILEDALNILKDYSLIQVESDNLNHLKIKVHRTILLVLRKYDLNEGKRSMFKTVLKTMLLNFYKFNHINTVFKYVKKKEFKGLSIQVYHENSSLATKFLSYLARFHCNQVLEELLPKFKEEHNRTNIYEETLNKMLYDAISNKNNDIFTIILLINYGAKIELSPETNGFHLASSWRSVDLFDRLLESNDSKNIINSKDRIGRTILHLLGQNFNENTIGETFECMLHLTNKWNANISIQDDESENILHTICQNSSINFYFVKIFIENCNCKYLVNVQNKWNETPLQALVQYNYSNPNLLKIFSYLLNECEAKWQLKMFFKKILCFMFVVMVIQI